MSRSIVLTRAEIGRGEPGPRTGRWKIVIELDVESRSAADALGDVEDLFSAMDPRETATGPVPSVAEEELKTIRRVSGSDVLTCRICNLLMKHGYQTCREAIDAEGVSGVRDWRGVGNRTIAVMREVAN